MRGALRGTSGRPPFASTVPERGFCHREIPFFLTDIVREQTVHAPPIRRREENGRSGGDRGVGGPIYILFTRALISIVTFTGGCRSGPPEEVVKPSEGLQGTFLVRVTRNLAGSCAMLPGGCKGAFELLVESALVRGFRDRAGRMLDGDTMVIGRTFIR